MVHPDPDKLYMRLMIAAVWIAAIPILGKYVILPISGVTFLLFGGILFLLGVIYFISARVVRKGAVLAAVLFLLCTIFGHSDSFAFWKQDIVYEGESVYNYLQVSEDEESVYLSTNVLFGVQSVYMKNDTLAGMYYDYALATPLYAGYRGAG